MMMPWWPGCGPRRCAMTRRRWARGMLLLSPTSQDRTWSMMGPDVDAEPLREMVESVAARYAVDREHVLLTGMSDGATYALYCGLREGMPFTHLAPACGVLHPALFAGGDLARADGRPIYLVHGALDWMFPVAAAQLTRQALLAAGARLVYREIEGRGHDPRVVVHQPRPVDLLRDDLGGGEAHMLGNDVADVDELAVEADHVEAFHGGRGDTDDLHHHVGAAPVREVFHALHAGVGGLELVHVDHVGGPALPRHVEAPRLAVDRDDFGRALLRGHGGGVDAEAPRALDHHDVPELHLRILYAVKDLAQGAVHGRDGVVGKHVGHLEDVVAGRQVVVIGVAAVAVRVLVEVELHAPARAMRAGVMLAADAPVAAIARIEEREGDAVALLEGPPEGVGLHAAPEAVHDPRELVAGHAPAIGARVLPVSAPVVEVGAADGRRGVPDENATRVDFGGGQGLELERLAGLVQYHGQSFGHRSLLCGLAVSNARYFTLSRSRNPSPTRLTARTVAARKAPGKRMIQNARCT